MPSKQCAKCGDIKSIEEFGKDKTRTDGLFPYCKMCKRSNDKTYQQHNAEQKKKYKAEWQKKNKEHVNVKHQEYRESNKERVAGWNKKWNEANKDKLVVKQHRHRHKLLNTRATLTAEHFKKCLAFFNYKDAYTGEPMEVVTQDHIIPKITGGEYIPANIIPCDKRTNDSKGGTPMIDWYKKQPFFSQDRLNKISEWIEYAGNL